MTPTHAPRRLEATHTSQRAGEYLAPGGAWNQPSLDALLTDAARRHPHATLVVDATARLDASELLQRVDHVAASLEARGVGAGDAVAWQLPNCVEAIVAMRACWRLDAIAVPLHPAFTAIEVERVLARIRPAVTITAADLATAASTDRADRNDRTPRERSDGTTIAVVLFTSGSSGAPKGVLHTQHTLAYKARTMAAVHGLGPDDVVLMPAPLAHVSGLLNGVTLPGAVPFRTVLMRKWNVDDALDLIEREGVTFMVGPPTFFVGLMRAPGFTPHRVATLRVVSSGGAGVSAAFMAEASERLGCVVKRTYGSTEAPTVATSSAAAADDAARAIGQCEFAVDARGELLIRGPELCAGYLDAADTEHAFTNDGWYRSGDLATIDGDGRLTILGRVDDVIIRGGENIAAAEVEAIIEGHPAIHQCVVVGYADDLMGERACAFVVATAHGAPGTDDDDGGGAFDLASCAQWCAAQGLARFKTPEMVIVLDALPVLSSGKADRAALRSLAEAARVSRS